MPARTRQSKAEKALSPSSSMPTKAKKTKDKPLKRLGQSKKATVDADEKAKTSEKAETTAPAASTEHKVAKIRIEHCTS